MQCFPPKRQAWRNHRTGRWVVQTKMLVSTMSSRPCRAHLSILPWKVCTVYVGVNTSMYTCIMYISYIYTYLFINSRQTCIYTIYYIHPRCISGNLMYLYMYFYSPTQLLSKSSGRVPWFSKRWNSILMASWAIGRRTRRYVVDAEVGPTQVPKQWSFF